MNLKPQSTKATITSLVAPSWGELADDGYPASVVVFESGEATYSYPYHTLSRWVLTQGETDTLQIQAGRDELSIEGQNLRLINDALCRASLRLLRVTNDHYSGANEMVVVRSIRFKET